MHDRDTPTIQAPSLYEKRRAIFPKAVSGPFRRFKWGIMIATLAVYYLTPWLRWDRGPYAPDQAVLIDMVHRRFYMFGIEIWSHEFYFVAGLLIMAGIGLFLVTSAVGRAWCGYACPQTVWTDLFQHIDRMIDGDRNAQLRLAQMPWRPSKIARRLAKWSIYLVISFWTGGAWIMYFADAPTLTVEFWTGRAAPAAYGAVAILTATTFVLGGFLREQFCIYMCPWPRIQTAMLDEKSLIVTYKHWRGEPRGSMKSAKSAKNVASVETAGKSLSGSPVSQVSLGDCIDCNQCVAVCPTGIDIRDGSQVGCITCALCIDACDRVMEQVGRPRGLIDYATLDDTVREQQGQAPVPLHKTLLRARTLVYFGVWSGIGLGLLFLLENRARLEISAMQERNPPYVQMSDGSVRNAYIVKVRNMQPRPRQVEIGLAELDYARLWINEEGQRSTASDKVRLTVPADSLTQRKIFVLVPGSGSGSGSGSGKTEASSADAHVSITVRALDSEGGADSDRERFTRGKS